jgi:hypothetical protein
MLSKATIFAGAAALFTRVAFAQVAEWWESFSFSYHMRLSKRSPIRQRGQCGGEGFSGSSVCDSVSPLTRFFSFLPSHCSVG